MDIKVEKFVEGRDCYRCGISRQEARRIGAGCSVYGFTYRSHMFTDKSNAHAEGTPIKGKK